MRYQELIHSFMEKKKNILYELLSTKNTQVIDNYYTEIDKSEVLSWDDILSESIWMQLQENISNGSCGISGDTCPFCLVYIRNCPNCPYGENHGICAYSVIKNDYDQLLKIMHKERKYISNNIYRKIIKDIEDNV